MKVANTISVAILSSLIFVSGCTLLVFHAVKSGVAAVARSNHGGERHDSDRHEERHEHEEHHENSDHD